MTTSYTLSGVLLVEVSDLRPHRAEGIRICVTGGRDIDDLGYVWSWLDTMHCLPKQLGGRGPIIELGAGCARGVDKLALAWAEINAVPWRKYVADWDRLGTPAGVIRNGVMLEDFKPELLGVYDGSVGTTDCARQARKMKIERDFYSKSDGSDPFAAAEKWG